MGIFWVTVTVGARNALDIGWICLVASCQGVVAMLAKDGCARRLQVVVDGDSLIEDETLALPQR